MKIRSGRPYFQKTSSVYQRLASLEPGLMLDVGAAAGHMSRLMLRHSPRSHVIAFEPFPGNWRFLEDTVGSDSRVKIIRKAVADTAGVSRFQVGKTVDSNSPERWAKMTGYSSVGKLAPDAESNSIEVETVRLDDYIEEPVVFVKIDVQGAEYKVLLGAKRSLDAGLITALLIEFSGEPSIMELLLELGYQPLDNEYLIMNTRGEPDPLVWDDPTPHVLSTGRTCYKGWPRTIPEDPLAYCEWLRAERRKLGGLQTDLLFVAAQSVDRFLRAPAASEYQKLES